MHMKLSRCNPDMIQSNVQQNVESLTRETFMSCTMGVTDCRSGLESNASVNKR